MTPTGTEQAEEGRVDRLAELYVSSAPAAIRLAYLLTGDRTLAEDLVQEAFVRFVGRLQYLRDPNSFDAYLRRTILNLSKNHFRHKAVERSYTERQGPPPPADPPDPAIVAYETMRAALLTLPERQRAAIVLRYYEDLPEPQIAQLLGCLPATVRSLVARGLQTLREASEVTR